MRITPEESDKRQNDEFDTPWKEVLRLYATDPGQYRVWTVLIDKYAEKYTGEVSHKVIA